MSVAVYGGSFDPIHNGHLALCRAAMEQVKADRLLLLPTAQSPHRDNRGKTAFSHRYAMCELAAKELENAQVSDLERRLGGVNYTVRTVGALQREFPGEEIFLIVGGDMLLSFHQWKDYRVLLQTVTLLAGAREVGQRRALEAYCAARKEFSGRVRLVDFSPISVSSTALRARAAAGKPLDDFVPKAVAEYIAVKGLYGNAQCAIIGSNASRCS